MCSGVWVKLNSDFGPELVQDVKSMMSGASTNTT